MLNTTRVSLSRNILLLVLASLVTLAWIVLWYPDESAQGNLFHLHTITDQPSTGIFFLAGWLLMTVAMMLPTTFPLITLFNRMIIRKPYAGFLLVSLISGYLLSWLTVGIVALGLLWGIEQFQHNSSFIQSNTWSILLLLLAGTFQFSSLKYTCLDKCRSPFGFIHKYWHGRNGLTESFRIGLYHGLFCVGCCWALMLLMFAVNTAGLVWMLFLTLFMTVEKNFSWGRFFSMPLGAVLIISGIGLLLYEFLS